MKNQLYTLQDIFSNKIFRIPDYQRGYCWEKRQLEDFLRDLRILRNKKDHYAGMITVTVVPEDTISRNEHAWQAESWLLESGYKAYYVVDGQQRLTTSVILINEIIKHFDKNQLLHRTPDEWAGMFLYRKNTNNYFTFIFGYENDEQSFAFYTAKILELQSMGGVSILDKTLYTSNMEYAKDFFNDYLGTVSLDDAALLFKKLVTNFKFNYFEVEDIGDVFITFETMNNRGKDLSTLELLKNRLIYLSSLIEDSHTGKMLRENINSAWKVIFEYLGKSPRIKLDDERFLRNLCIMYFGPDREHDKSFKDYLLVDIFTEENFIENKTLTIDSINLFLNAISLASVQWYYLNDPENSVLDVDTQELMNKILRLGTTSFHPLILASLIKYSQDLMGKDQLDQILSSIERFIFLIYNVSMRKSNAGASKYQRVANSIFHDKIDCVSLVADINNDIDGNDSYDGWLNLETFLASVNDWFTRENALGFYSWPALKYFLYEYELQLQGPNKEKVKWDQVKAKELQETVEHILPQTPSDPYWQRRVKPYRDKKLKMLTHSLGNLLLLSMKKNATLQNYSFPRKKVYKCSDGTHCGYDHGSYSEIDVSLKPDWTPKHILQRGMVLLKFMETRWNISFSDWDIKEKVLLNLKFIK